jgi:SAM-dependent methyltransferase
MPASDWLEFWDGDHLIYVNAVHEAAHCRGLARDMLPYAPPGGTMLDYGCGEALSADVYAGPTSRLFLCESAPNKRLRLAVRFAGNDKIAVRRPQDIAAMPDWSMDTIVVHSVVQYLKSPELMAMLKLFHRLLKPGGILVIGDVIPRKMPALTDVVTLLRFGRREGFFFAALRGLVWTYFSDYRQLRNALGIARYAEAEMIDRLKGAGFAAERARSNIGHNNRRMTFIARAQ